MLRIVLRDVDDSQTVDMHLVTHSTLRSAAANGVDNDWCDAASYAAYVAGLHDASFGVNAGWDRFIDRHVGVATNATSLDTHVTNLNADGIGWHAHLDTKVDGVSYGSAWTAVSAGGLGLEIYAPSDSSYFDSTSHATTLNPLNFCNRTTACDSIDACAAAVVVTSSRQRYSFQG